MEAALETLVNSRITPDKGLDAVLCEIAGDESVSMDLRILACKTLTKDQI